MNISKEDYIKAIYELGGQSRKVANKEIAEKLKISPPSVSEMIKKLEKEDYIIVQQYIGVSLTEKGIEKGKNIRKKHLLWEVFLVEKLGYSWEEVDEEAEQLEHVTDDRLQDRLEKFLDYPKFCPHGNSIGDEIDFVSLDKVGVGSYEILRIGDYKEVLVFSMRNHIKIGEHIKVLEVEKDGYRVLVKAEELFIKEEFLKQIYIVEG